ncbi:hypothetical protein AAFF_G00230070 [Aldrovandia affinis]|uniref:Uncharacterized protein n=1 Tax=Aldrovandia affinis TaxID=143900 RepID=A0AAD7SVP7_9TELE|nr:hypothetical protein AAFF_G00230070 [Aldrovandia affinis]
MPVAPGHPICLRQASAPGTSPLLPSVSKATDYDKTEHRQRGTDCGRLKCDPHGAPVPQHLSASVGEEPKPRHFLPG